MCQYKYYTLLFQDNAQKFMTDGASMRLFDIIMFCMRFMELKYDKNI